MSYEDDYKAAVANGSLLDPMPDNYVSVRSLADEWGIDITTLLESGANGASQGLYNAGIRDDAKYNKDFEVYIPQGDVSTLRDYVSGTNGG